MPILAAPDQITFGAIDIYPYVNIVDGNISPEKSGSSVDFVKLIQDRLGIHIKIKTCPTKRCFLMLGDGQIDGLPMASFSEKRLKNYGAYPMKNGKLDTLRKNSDGSYYLYTLKNSSVTWDGEKIHNAHLPIGVNLGFSISKFIKKQNIKALGNSSVAANLNMLLKKRLSGVASFQMAADTLIRENNRYKPIIKMPIALRYKPYFTMLSHQFVKENPEFAERIWDIASEIGRSGQYQNLLKKYNK